MRKRIALWIFIIGILSLVTIQQLIRIHSHRQVLASAWTTTGHQTPILQPDPVRPDVCMDQLQALAERRGLRMESMELQRVEQGVLEQYALRMQLHGTPAEVAAFTQELADNAVVRLRELTITQIGTENDLQELTVQMSLIGSSAEGI